ncbi:MAG: hypothetical protein RBT76_02935 [candidate division Zixibacteria bacterium]|nr:hypothetical protein [candidate division Zixibacteria bacterium]
MTGDSCVTFATIIPAAVGDPRRLTPGWDAIHVNALAGIDNTADGRREVLFSRSAKTDSAFQRALVAWDVAGDSAVWVFEVPDCIGPESFEVYDAPNQPAILEAVMVAHTSPEYPTQQRAEFENDGRGPILLEITACPRFNHDRMVDGTIVLIEDIGEKTRWERKAVFGEAAQPWVHRLKGSMATARIT